ncbi:MAG TPA: PAS domain-containing protein [Burkholderiaceae bacterium]
MRIGPQPGAWRVNAAAHAWAERGGSLAGVERWGEVAAELQVALSAGNGGHLAALGLDWRPVALGDGWLVWFCPSAAPPTLRSWSDAADKLALVQDMLDVGVFERDLRSGEARWDAQMYKLFDLDPAAGPPTFDAGIARVHPGDRAVFLARRARYLREGGRHRHSFRIVRSDGSVRDLLSLIEVRHDTEGRPLALLGVHIDDSEGAGRMRVQRAVTDYLHRALEMAKVSVWREDFATRRVQFNRAGYDMAGIEAVPDGIPIETARRWIHPDDLAKVALADAQAARGHDIVDTEVRHWNGDSAPIPLSTRRVAERDETGTVIGMFGVTLDLSAQVAERERAAALSRRIELIAEAADLGIWSVEGDDGLLEWNQQMLEIYGLTREQRPLSLTAWRDEFVHPEDRGKLTESRELATRLATRAVAAEFRILRSDGTVRWVTSRSRRDDRDGHVTLTGIHLDTTDLVMQRRIAEHVLQEKEMALRASQARSEFLARASHELRTPLNAVIGFAQLIEHDGAGASAALQLERVGHIRLAGEHLLALVDDVLDLAAIEAGRLGVSIAPVAIDQVLGEVARWSESLAQRHGVAIEVRPCGGWVQADARRLRQLVANLVSNAIKFNHRGGTVWLSARQQDEHDAVRAATVRRWQLCVRDDGRGVAAADRDHLFEAFNRLGVEREGIIGVGLGLAIAAKLTELMHGRVEVSSTLGQGSEFRVVLEPAAGADAAPAAAALPSAVAPVLPPPVPPPVPPPELLPEPAPLLTTLYIEDNAVNVILVEGLVALRPGVELHCAVDGLSGVAMAIARKPQVVLIDMQLPDIDGFEVLRRLRAEPTLRGTRMVALSANGVTADISRAMAEGFDDYWTKPIDFKVFLKRLDAMIEEARSLAP